MSQDSLGDILTGDTFLSDSVHNVPHPVTAGVRTERRGYSAQPEGGEGSLTKSPGLKFFSREDKLDKKIEFLVKNQSKSDLFW